MIEDGGYGTDWEWVAEPDGSSREGGRYHNVGVRSPDIVQLSRGFEPIDLARVASIAIHVDTVSGQPTGVALLWFDGDEEPWQIVGDRVPELAGELKARAIETRTKRQRVAGSE